VLSPFSLTNATVTLTSVTIDNSGNATVAWSSCVNGTARTGSVTNLIPAGLLVPNTSVIWGEATYNYKPAIGWVITGTLQMYDQIFLRPRQSTSPSTAPLAAARAHSGTTVVDLIFSMAKREVTFLRGTVAIIFL
jgi:hypothetical protein